VLGGKGSWYLSQIMTSRLVTWGKISMKIEEVGSHVNLKLTARFRMNISCPRRLAWCRSTGAAIHSHYSRRLGTALRDVFVPFWLWVLHVKQRLVHFADLLLLMFWQRLAHFTKAVALTSSEPSLLCKYYVSEHHSLSCFYLKHSPVHCCFFCVYGLYFYDICRPN
jgi:hypothetical protein